MVEWLKEELAEREDWGVREEVAQEANNANGDAGELEENDIRK